MRTKADETLVIVETLICPLQISHKTLVVLPFDMQKLIASRSKKQCIYV